METTKEKMVAGNYAGKSQYVIFHFDTDKEINYLNNKFNLSNVRSLLLHKFNRILLYTSKIVIGKCS